MSSLLLQDPGSVEAQSVQGNLWQYKRDLRSVRKQRRNEMAAEYVLLKLILRYIVTHPCYNKYGLKINKLLLLYRTWNQLKAQRDNQGYSSTTAWLHIKK
jgi:hypothetical protein